MPRARPRKKTTTARRIAKPAATPKNAGGRPKVLIRNARKKGEKRSPFDAFMHALRLGVTIEGAAAHAGVTRSTVFGYLKQGKHELFLWRKAKKAIQRQIRDARRGQLTSLVENLKRELDALAVKRPDSAYVQFLDAATRAMDEAEALHVENIAIAAAGIKEVRKGGRLVRRGFPGDWRASAWLLERRKRKQYAAQTTVKHGLDDAPDAPAVFELKISRAGAANPITAELPDATDAA
jgi:hypothetical protein